MGDNSIILSGKNFDSLVEEGLNRLRATKDQVDVEVLESKKGLFSSNFKVKITLKSTAAINKIEKGIEDIINDSMLVEQESCQEALEFLYQPEGVYIKLCKSLPIEEISSRIEIKKIQNASLELIEAALKENKLEEPIKIADTQDEVKIDSKCEFRFGSDNLEAFIYVSSPLGGNDITIQAIHDALKENKIVFGINEEEIKRIVQGKLYNIEIKIAEGMGPVDGIDAKLEYHFDITSGTKLLEDEGGKIDYRELSLIKNVKAGQALVTIVPQTEGIPGKNVLGEEMPAKSGKAVQLPKGKNVSISDDSMQLLSNIDGEVKLIDGKVNVFAVYMVPVNVDNSTGNIRFVGKVIVKGNVITGFSIEADGDVEVYGVVEGAKIVSKGNIILHRGIQGMNKGELYCDGDLAAKFIENSIIDVKGNIHSDAIMHSHIICGKKLEAAGRKGLLVGGTFKVSDEIKAKVIGSPMATITELEVGVNPDMRKRFEQLKQEHKSIIENLEKVTQAVDLLTKISQKAELPLEKRELLSKSIQAKLQLTQKLDINGKDIKEMETYLEELSKGKIKVVDVIYPGVRITIGSSMMYVKDPLQYLTLYKSGADIKIGPYEN